MHEANLISGDYMLVRFSMAASVVVVTSTDGAGSTCIGDMMSGKLRYSALFVTPLPEFHQQSPTPSSPS